VTTDDGNHAAILAQRAHERFEEITYDYKARRPGGRWQPPRSGGSCCS
jgi:hypothetical protein